MHRKHVAVRTIPFRWSRSVVSSLAEIISDVERSLGGARRRQRRAAIQWRLGAIPRAPSARNRFRCRHGEVLFDQFSERRINSDDVWNLIDRTKTHHEKAYDELPVNERLTTRVRLTLRTAASAIRPSLTRAVPSYVTDRVKLRYLTTMSAFVSTR